MSDEKYTEETSYKNQKEIMDAINKITIFGHLTPVHPQDILYEMNEVISHINPDVSVIEGIKSFTDGYEFEHTDTEHTNEAEIATALGDVIIFNHLVAVSPADLFYDVGMIVSHINPKVSLRDIKNAFNTSYGQ